MSTYTLVSTFAVKVALAGACLALYLLGWQGRAQRHAGWLAVLVTTALGIVVYVLALSVALVRP